MRLFYYKSRSGNFGDDLNGWLWKRLAPEVWSDDSETLFTGIGTIIGNPMPASKRIVVFSSGFGYSPIPADWNTSRWNVAAVRGPLTAKILNLPSDDAVADGALLLRTLPDFAVVPQSQRNGTIFVPHHAALRTPGWQEASDRAGIELLDPRRDSHDVIRRISSAKLVIADSMHAAIIADAMRVPWIPVATSNHISTFKWLDWAKSLEVIYEPTRLSAPSADLAFESAGQPFYGEGHLISPPSVEVALEKMREAIKAASARGGDFIRRRRKDYWTAAPRRARLVPGMRQIEKILDARLIDRSARQLSLAAERAGYLSETATLDAKIAELHRRFEKAINE